VEERVSCAVQPSVDEAWDRVRAADVKHTDGTSWYQGGVTMALWTLAASGVTVFKILANSSKNTLRPLYGALNGILVSDRAKALNFWAMDDSRPEGHAEDSLVAVVRRAVLVAGVGRGQP
jgi:transposase